MSVMAVRGVFKEAFEDALPAPIGSGLEGFGEREWDIDKLWCGEKVF